MYPCMFKVVTLVLLVCSPLLHAEETLAFADWLAQLKTEAREVGISSRTVELTFKHAQLLPRVVQLDRSQPEFISTFLSYISRRVNPTTVEKGRSLLQQHQALLDNVESQYGVPKQLLVAFWGMETNYGHVQGDFNLPSALMTLAYEGRRAEFFRNELFNLMRIVDAKHNTVSHLRGSWAGAMGHMQFMPSTFMRHGVDGDADGRINLWGSLPDAFYSAANYLAKAGWQPLVPIAAQVSLPDGFDYAQAQLKKRKTVAEWVSLGVKVPVDWLALENTAILLPQGRRGPAFMVSDNFDVVMDWNRSVNYALAVAHLTQQLSADSQIVLEAQVETEALSFNQMWALQGRLNELGYDSGKPDGFPGLKTQEAIRLYQASQGLPQDGYASPSLYHRLLNN